MDYLKSYLDTNESPVELIPLLDVCITISKNYRKVFADYLNVRIRDKVVEIKILGHLRLYNWLVYRSTSTEVRGKEVP